MLILKDRDGKSESEMERGQKANGKWRNAKGRKAKAAKPEHALKSWRERDFKLNLTSIRLEQSKSASAPT